MTKEENIKFREEVIKKRFINSLGYELNLDNPRTFNEKIQWLKLYNHDPLITKCADKYLAREYIKEKIGEEYLIPLLGVWDNPDDIDFDALPNQFVLKVNWGWAQNIIVKDKTKLDIEEVKNKLNNWLDPLSNHYYHNFEWGYKNIKPKIICEKYIEQLNGQLYDYKVFCFNGKPKYIGVYLNRGTNSFASVFYDIYWNKLNLIRSGNTLSINIDKPFFLNKMFEISSILSKDFYHVRVDFYNIDSKILFGELTFFTSNGNGKFMPEEWDYKWGELLELPKEKKIEYDILDRETLIQQATLLEPISIKYKELLNKIKVQNNIIKSKNDTINSKDDIIKYKDEEIKNINRLVNSINLNINWFNFLTLFAISNNKEYIRIIIFGLKFTFRVNENSINKISWWIPVKKWRESFRSKFKIRPDQTRPDQTRPDQTRPDQTRPDLICKEYIQFYNNSKTKKLQPMLHSKNAA